MNEEEKCAGGIIKKTKSYGLGMRRNLELARANRHRSGVRWLPAVSRIYRYLVSDLCVQSYGTVCGFKMSWFDCCGGDGCGGYFFFGFVPIPPRMQSIADAGAKRGILGIEWSYGRKRMLASNNSPFKLNWNRIYKSFALMIWCASMGSL